MAVICPTVTAYEPHQYRAQMERIEPFAARVHIDLMDGDFAPTKSPDITSVWWPDGLAADIHLMYRWPAEHLTSLIRLRPQLVVLHVEAKGNLVKLAEQLHAANIRAGLALLHDTPLDNAKDLLSHFDHVLVFSGHLGYHGGEADLRLLDKVRAVSEQFPELEVAWDGGINDQNAARLIEAGVNVLNVGGFIQNAPDPKQAYEKINAMSQS